MREINMQYPLDFTGSNRYFDGNIHRISPRQLSSFIINNTKYYLLNYYDISVEKEMITILVNINGHLCKLPLNDYNSLFGYIDRLPIHRENLDILPNNIYLTETFNTEQILQINGEFAKTRMAQASARRNGGPPPPPPGGPSNYKKSPSYLCQAGVRPKRPLKNDVTDVTISNKKENVYIIDLYVPYNDNNEIGGVYMYTNNSRDGYGNEEYRYEQFIDKGLNKDLEEMLKKGYSHITTTILISADSENIRRKYGYDKNGKLKKYDVFVLPGIYEYDIHFIKTDKERADASIAASLVVSATFPEYCGEKHKYEAIRDSYHGKLTQRFYAPNKEFSATDNNRKRF